MKCSVLLYSFLAAASISSASATPAVIDLADTNSDSVFEIYGGEGSEISGAGLATADFDGDGVDDLCFGAPSYNASVCSVYIFFGAHNRDMNGSDGSSAPVGDDFIRIDAETPVGMFGYSCTGGDFNGDGIGDFAIGSPDEIGQGRVYIVFGKAGAREIKESIIGNGFDSCVISGFSYSIQFGYDVGSGDFDGDGCDDLLVGAPSTVRNGVGNTGEAYIVFGNRDLQVNHTIDCADNADCFLVIMAESEFMRYAYSRFGYSTASGDVNGDGFDDVIVSAPYIDTDGEVDNGTVYVVFGGNDIKTLGTVDFSGYPSGTLIIKGKRSFNCSGTDVAAGDIDGDGLDDIVINAGGASPDYRYGAGESYIVRGSASLSTRETLSLRNRPSDVVTVMGEDNDGMMGPVALGDCNGDGFMDIITGALRLSPEARNQAGKGYVIYGSKGFFTRPIIDLLSTPANGVTSVFGASQDDSFGSQTISGDFNGDGVSDAVFTAPKKYDNQEKLGNVYILWGSSFNTPETNYFTCLTGTGVSATLRVPSSIAPDIIGEPFETGDIIGVFTPSGLCAGAGTWNGTDLDIIVWGDNPDDEDIDGFRDGESCAFRIYDVSDRLEFAAEASCSSGEMTFRHDSIITLAGLTVVSSSGDAPVHFTPSSSGGSREKILVVYNISNYNFAPRFINGDEIAVVTQSGVCAGAGVWKADCDLLLTVLGDDPATETVEGFTANEKLRFVRWDSVTHEELALLDETNAGIGVEVYTPDSTIEVTHLHLVSLEVEDHSMPSAFTLSQNTPNPFNPATTIRFSLAGEARVTLDIYAVSGAKIATLADSVMSTGEHEVQWDASGFPSGVYFCRLRAGANVKTMKMVLVK